MLDGHIGHDHTRKPSGWMGLLGSYRGISGLWGGALWHKGAQKSRKRFTKLSTQRSRNRHPNDSMEQALIRGFVEIAQEKLHRLQGIHIQKPSKWQSEGAADLAGVVTLEFDGCFHKLTQKFFCHGVWQKMKSV